MIWNHKTSASLNWKRQPMMTGGYDVWEALGIYHDHDVKFVVEWDQFEKDGFAVYWIYNGNDINYWPERFPTIKNAKEFAAEALAE